MNIVLKCISVVLHEIETSLTKCFASSNLITYTRHPTDLAHPMKSESSEYAECGVKCSEDI